MATKTTSSDTPTTDTMVSGGHHYCIVSDGGRQYRVSEGQEIEVDFRPIDAGSELVFELGNLSSLAIIYPRCHFIMHCDCQTRNILTRYRQLQHSHNLDRHAFCSFCHSSTQACWAISKNTLSQ